MREAIRTPRLMDILRGGPTVTLHIENFGSVHIYVWNLDFSIRIKILRLTVSKREQTQ